MKTPRLQFGTYIESYFFFFICARRAFSQMQEGFRFTWNLVGNQKNVRCSRAAKLPSFKMCWLLRLLYSLFLCNTSELASCSHLRDGKQLYTWTIGRKEPECNLPQLPQARDHFCPIVVHVGFELLETRSAIP